MTLTVPRGTLADVVLPRGGQVRINGKAGDLRGLKPGAYAIDDEGLPADAWSDPTLAAAASRTERGYSLRASSSHEEGGFGLANLFAPAEDKTRKGFSSEAHASDKSTEWVEIDLGAAVALSKIVLLPRGDTPSKEGTSAGFPRDFTVQLATDPGAYKTVATYTDCPVPGAEGMSVNFYTVIGYPSARYIRVAATRLGAPASDEPLMYRLQLGRIRLINP